MKDIDEPRRARLRIELGDVKRGQTVRILRQVPASEGAEQPNDLFEIETPTGKQYLVRRDELDE